MEKKTYKNIELSRLGMGNMRLPVVDGTDSKIDYEKGSAIIDYAYEHGVNYYDTAYVYHGGKSEEFVGKALKKYARESFSVATKFNYMANPDYKAVFEEQLARLDMEYIDFYLIHAVMNNNYEDYLNCGCIDYFLEQQKAGRIKYLGFSSHADPEVLDKFASHHQWDFAQIQLNYFDWNYGTAKEEYEILSKHNLPIVVMEPVRGGRLAALTPDAEAMLKEAHPDWSIASWALRFVGSLPQVQTILSGMGNMEQITDNVNTFSDGYVFTEADRELLFKACDMFKTQLQVPCTSCRYCTPNCPVEINIPEVLKVYNSYKVNGDGALRELENIDSVGKPQDCVGCGACQGHCPQTIQIPDIMGELKKVLK